MIAALPGSWGDAVTATQAAPSAAKPSPKPSAKLNEITVSLFGQNCTLSGPFPESVLKSVHAISPEQIPIEQTPETLKKNAQKVRAAKEVPPLLEHYRDQLLKHLSARVAFQDGLAVAKKSNQSAPLIEATRESLDSAKSADFATLVKSLEAKEKPSAWSAPTTEHLLSAYETMIEPRPEEEFHRAIQRSNIRYNCAFEESDDEE